MMLQEPDQTRPRGSLWTRLGTSELGSWSLLPFPRGADRRKRQKPAPVASVTAMLGLASMRLPGPQEVLWPGQTLSAHTLQRAGQERARQDGLAGAVPGTSWNPPASWGLRRLHADVRGNVPVPELQAGRRGGGEETAEEVGLV